MAHDSVRDKIIGRLKSVHGILMVLICLSLAVFVYSNKSLFEPIPESADTTNWLDIYYFLFILIMVLFLRFLLLPVSNDIRRLKPIAVIPLSIAFGTLWYYTLEIVFNYSYKLIETRYIVAGILIAALFFAVLLLLSNSLRITCIIGSFFYFIWAIAEYYTQKVRGIPVQIQDLEDISTALDVAGNYTYEPTAQITTMAVLLICVCTAVILSGRYVIAINRNKQILTHCSGAMALAVLFLLLTKGTAFDCLKVSIDGNIPAASFRLYGTELAFIEGVRESHITVPDGYSVERLTEEASKYSASGCSSSKPNIIVVMDESFADIDISGNLGLAKEVMPNYTDLHENTIKGKVLVSTLGGGTGKSEYEFLTGNSMHLYSSFISPYVRLGSKLNYSLARILSEQGYATYAIHPFTPSNYNRAVTYSAMGFDRFYTLEDFPDPKYYHGFISDESCFEKIFDLVDETENPVFTFCVTIQNHSPYNMEGFKTKVDLDGDYPEAEEFLTLMRRSDRELGKLIKHFKNCYEDTMIVFFGDHFPALPDSFWEYDTGISRAEEDYDMRQLYYATPFFIWTNYGMEEQKDVMISTNYLGAYALSLSGVKLTPYQHYLLSLRDTIPAFSAFSYYGTDNHFHEYGSDTDIDDAISVYDSFQYNENFDPKHQIPDFYSLNSGQ